MELNKIYNIDCIDGLKQLEDMSVNLIYADMPYDYFDFRWIDECYRVLDNDGSIYIQTDFRSVAELKNYLDYKFEKFIFRNWIVWCYRGIARKAKGFQFNHDDILFYSKSEIYKWKQPYQKPSESTLKRWGKYADKNGDIPFTKLTPSMQKKGKSMSIRDTRMRDWWEDISVVGFKEAKNGKLHEFQKPLNLVKRIIDASSYSGDTILDPFMGSGTTALACIDMHRKFIGFEINKKYYKIASNRIQNRIEQQEAIDMMMQPPVG